MDNHASTIKLLETLESLGAPIGCVIPEVDAPAIEFSKIVAPPLKQQVKSTVPLPDIPLTSPPAVDHLEPFSTWEDFKNSRYNNCNAAAWANVRRIVTSRLGAEETYPPLQAVFDFYKTQNPEFTGEGNSPFKGDNGMNIQDGLNHLVTHGGPDGKRALAFARVDVTKPEAVKLAIAIFGTLWVGLRVYTKTIMQFNDGTPWTHPRQPTQRPPFGHAAVVGAYDSNYHVITWGKRATLTPEYWNGAKDDDTSHPNVFDAYVVIWDEHISTRRFMHGINLKQLAEEFKAMTKGDMKVPATQFNSLYRCINNNSSESAMSLQVCDAEKSYSVASDPITISITESDASYGMLVSESKDLYLIKTENTASDMIEIQRAASPGFAKTETWVSGFSSNERNNGTWTIDNANLYFIKVDNTNSGSVEVWWTTRQDRFLKPKHYVTGLKKSDVGFGTYAIGGDNLYRIVDVENDSGFVQVSVAKAYAQYSLDSTQHFTTAFVINDVRGTGRWTISQNGDLYLIKTKGTASGLVEIHVASNESGYQSLSHFSTGFKADGSGVWIL